MYINAEKACKEISTSKGVSKLTLQTAVGKREFTWWAQHNKNIFKDDNKINGSGCAECATRAAANAFGIEYVGLNPYDFRHKFQKSLLGHMNMPWDCYDCQKILEASGLVTDYHHQAGVKLTYQLIKEHLLRGMPVVTWVWHKDIDGHSDKRYTNYAHVILLVGITLDDKAVILDSGSHGPLRIMDLMDVCRHCLPGNWLNGFILVYPQVYRVRKTWKDKESQIGAYVNLENAQAAVEEEKKKGKTYTVYNSSGIPVWPYYRVRESWEKADTQIAACTLFKNAKLMANLNALNVYDNWGTLLHTGTMPELPLIVSLPAGADIYAEPAGDVVGHAAAGKYTIMDVAKVGIVYGRMKSGAGWVSLQKAEQP